MGTLVIVGKQYQYNELFKAGTKLPKQSVKQPKVVVGSGQVKQEAEGGEVRRTRWLRHVRNLRNFIISPKSPLRSEAPQWSFASKGSFGGIKPPASVLGKSIILSKNQSFVISIFFPPSAERKKIRIFRLNFAKADLHLTVRNWFFQFIESIFTLFFLFNS
eukprot:TRINITY_DN2321_c3_g1_i1.p1 TRINITY_DN2321_c3_g1~~TRINITY_DN2321_c3_g1_i1.p1  ORF type:complete len:161 (+),score=12.28 TRINITY_DN2321_c3_g1_i1:41-523(+)